MTKTAKPTPNTTPIFGRFSLSNSSIVRLFYVALGVFVVSAILLLSALASERRVQQVPTVQAQHGYKVGTRLSAGVTDVTLQSIRFERGDGVFQTAGKTYAIASLEIKNRSARPINIIPTTDTYIKDAENTAHYITPYTLQSPFHAGELAPGDTISGELSYLVPESGSLRLYVDALWSGSSLSYAIR